MPPRGPAILPLILSCEHASAYVPARFAQAFRSRAAQKALASHRGVDGGALGIARSLARSCEVSLLTGRQTRLLIDLNRSPGHRALLSEWSRHLPARDVHHLLAIHRRHFEQLRGAVQAARGAALHLAVHTFTPVLAGERRNFDVGLLYDPGRAPEVQWADRLHQALRSHGLRVRRNAPYRGTADGAPTWLRRQFSPARYVGLELELNQSFLWHEPDPGRRRAVLAALLEVLQNGSATKSQSRR